jgi:hypothetical protein
MSYAYSQSVLLPQLPITAGEPYAYYAVGKLLMPARNPGQNFVITAKCELTSSLDYNCMVGCFINYGMPEDGIKPLCIMRSDDIYAGEAGHKRLQEQALVCNITLTNAGVSLTQAGGWAVSFVLYAASDAYVEGDTIKVEGDGYHEMWAV